MEHAIIVLSVSIRPRDTLIIKVSEDVEPLILRSEDKLLRPAATIPTEDHKFLNSVVESACVENHVIELVGQTHLWEEVLIKVTEWISIEEVLILIEFVNPTLTEAILADGKVVVFVDTLLEA